MLDHNLLNKPSEFKARAFLDTARGQTIPRKYCSRPTKPGWHRELKKLVQVNDPVPDRWWGTNCTPERWSVAESLKLRPSSFVVWHWLHAMEPDIELTEKDVASIIGVNRCRAIRLLIDNRLILGRCYSGGITRVYQVLEQPMNEAEYAAALRSTKFATILTNGSKTLRFYGNYRAFAQKHGLNENAVRRLVNGDLGSHRGYRLWQRGA